MTVGVGVAVERKGKGIKARERERERERETSWARWGCGLIVQLLDVCGFSLQDKSAMEP